MLRKVINISVLVLIVLATTGVSITKHFCGEQLKDISLTGNTKSCCGDECSCCHDEKIILKITDNFTGNTFVIDNAKVLSTLWMSFNQSVIQIIGLPSADSFTETLYALPPLILKTSSSFLQTFRC